MITALLRCTSNACNPLKSRGHSAYLWLSQYTRLPPHEYPISEYVVCKITDNLYATRSDVKIETSSCNLTAGLCSKADVLYYLSCNRLWEPTVLIFSMTPYNWINFFTLLKKTGFYRKITHSIYTTRSDVKIETSSCNLTVGLGGKADEIAFNHKTIGCKGLKSYKYLWYICHYAL